MDKQHELIVALDVAGFDAAKNLVDTLGDSVGFYKVGLELYCADGARTLDYLREQRKRVFLDLKLCDIPNTVAGALRSLLTRWGPEFVTVHASGGAEMMAAAQSAVRGTSTQLLAVTVLTSLGEENLRELGVNATAAAQAVRLARLAQASGLAGIVCSGQESSLIRAACGDALAIVTPGIRLADGAHDDQRRVTTPADAIARGATHIVVGRPITRADDPRAVAMTIKAQLACDSRGDDWVRDIFIRSGALLHGHFLLTSGRHSGGYLEKFNVLQHPQYTDLMCRALADHFRADRVDTVVGPATGGILLASATARHLGTRAIFTERVDGHMTFRRGFALREGERVLVVEDIVTTGGSVREVLEVVRAGGGVPVGVGLLVNRGGVRFDVPHTFALLNLDIATYAPGECPLCADGVPLTQRGRTGKA